MEREFRNPESGSEIDAIFEKVAKNYHKNKITKGSVWNMAECVDFSKCIVYYAKRQRVDFAQCGTTLGMAAHIYSCKVDALHQQALTITSGTKFRIASHRICIAMHREKSHPVSFP